MSEMEPLSDYELRLGAVWERSARYRLCIDLMAERRKLRELHAGITSALELWEDVGKPLAEWTDDIDAALSKLRDLNEAE